ncbi:hypothetical protein WG954_07770 [Lacibacter sp. H375]|uniref:hypothetical protein n=1 Tax=Lacibacter sp. H375 TaxID=3133424 RepID=UPI0030C502AF
MRNTFLYILLFISITSCKKSGTTDQPSVDIKDGTWRISYFWDQQDKTSNYTNYYFMFLDGGTLMAHGSSTTITGTWSQTGTRININFSNPAMSDLNGDWLKTEFTNSGIKLKDDSPSQDDQLYFVKN